MGDFLNENATVRPYRDTQQHEYCSKIIWIRLGNCSSRKIEALLRTEYEAIRNHLQHSPKPCLTLGTGR